MRLRTIALGIAALLATASMAHAAVVRETNFDDRIATFVGDDTYPGEIVNSTSDADPAGFGGSLAASLLFDTNGVTDTQHSVRMFVVDFEAPSGGFSDPSKLVFSFRARIEGLLDGVTSAAGVFGLNAGFNQPDPTYAEANVTFTDVWQTYSFSLADLDPGNAFNVQYLNDDAIYDFTLLDVLPGFGKDANNKLVIDEIQITHNPEPSNLAILAIAGLAMLRRRRA